MASQYLKSRKQFEKERVFNFDTRLFKHLDSTLPPEVQILLREKYNCAQYQRRIEQLAELRMRTLLIEIDHMLYGFTQVENNYQHKKNRANSLYYLNELIERLKDTQFNGKSWSLHKNRSYHHEDDYFTQYENDFFQRGEFSLFKTDKKSELADVKRGAFFDTLYELVIKHKLMAEYEINQFGLSKLKEIEQ